VAAGLKLGALGGPQTFSAQFAGVMRERFPEFAEIVYYPKTELGIAAALSGTIDATCVPEEMSTTGFHAGTQGRLLVPDAPAYVVAEIRHPYHCALLGKPGTNRARIRRILGHTGSSAQSRAWIEANLPDARIEVVDTHSLVAARAVLDGDGSIASIGTLALARDFGLAELASDIDGGCIGTYWAISCAPRFSDNPDRLVLTARLGEAGQTTGQFTRLIGALADTGFALQTVYTRPTERAVGEYDYVLRLCGGASLEAVRRVLGPFDSVRLAGAWRESR
jgi:prephenate dehydratase